MRWKYHPTYRKIRASAQQLLLPFAIFQLIRTLFFPTAFDVVILIVFIGLIAAVHLDWI